MTSPLIYGRMAKIQAAVGAVGKTKRNPQQGYQYRGVDDVMAALQSVMAEHGVFCVPDVVESERTIGQTKNGGTMVTTVMKVRHTFYAEDGSSVVAVTIGEASDMSDKSANKAMSAALKYALTGAYLIPTYEVDRDTEEHSPEVAQPKVQERPTPQEKARPQPPMDTDAFLSLSSLLQQVWPGEEGRGERMKWLWSRFSTGRQEMPEDWSPSKAWGQADQKRKASILDTAKALVESETHPEDRK